MVELLGAVVILGILMMVAIPSISSLIQNSKNKYYISQKKNLESAAKSYYENNKIILRNEGDYVDVSLEELVKKKYISKMVDGTKAECVMSKPVGNETSQEYTFVRIKKRR
jgi:Tfp pilus assembly protein PilE